MNIVNMLTDQLTDLRVQARVDKDFRLSDEIRNELDDRGSFCMDSPDGQFVYHMGKGWAREKLIDNIKEVDFNFHMKYIKQ